MQYRYLVSDLSFLDPKLQKEMDFGSQQILSLIFLLPVVYSLHSERLIFEDLTAVWVLR